MKQKGALHIQDLLRNKLDKDSFKIVFKKKKNNNKSILFLRPSYHSSFFLRDELRANDWKADIYVPRNFPQQLLYESDSAIMGPKLSKGGTLKSYLNTLILFFFFLKLIRGYKYLCFYGRADIFSFFERQLNMDKYFGRGVNVCLAIAKRLGKKIVYVPSGCHDEELKSNMAKYDNGNICGNCGYFNHCNESANNRHFHLIRRYSSLNISLGFYKSSEYAQCNAKIHSLDLSLWSPDLIIPLEHQIEQSNKLKILHSFVSHNRSDEGKNIKGSPFVVDAVERLKREGYNVELLYRENMHISQMRYLQAQADIVVDQLIYGCWGSTAAECITLGKPVICYLNAQWKENFQSAFGYSTLPIVEANTSNICEVLKRLVEDKEYRESAGKKSREFALQHFDPKKNAQWLSNLLQRV